MAMASNINAFIEGEIDKAKLKATKNAKLKCKNKDCGCQNIGKGLVGGAGFSNVTYQDESGNVYAGVSIDKVYLEEYAAQESKVKTSFSHLGYDTILSSYNAALKSAHPQLPKKPVKQKLPKGFVSIAPRRHGKLTNLGGGK